MKGGNKMKIEKLDNKELTDLFSVGEMEGVLDLVYGVRGSKSRDEMYKRDKNNTNGKLMIDYINEIIEDWEEFKDDYDDKDSFISEMAGNYTSVYNTELFKWYGEGSNRWTYADDYLKSAKDILHCLRLGQFVFMEGIIHKILEELE